MPTKKTPAKNKPQSKTEFVLTLPKTLSAGDVVKKAKAAGIEISEGYVHNIRSAAKRKAKKRPAKAPKVSGKKARVTRRKATAARKRKTGAAKKTVARAGAKLQAKPTVRATPRTGSLEERFVDLVLDLGLARSTALLAKIKDRVKGMTLG